MQTLVFDIKSDFAHFRKCYTTTSPLTYLIPPRTSIIGLIGAILGYSKEEYAILLQKCKVAIQIINPIKKMVFKENWRAGPATLIKKSLNIYEMQNISRVPLELVKEPQYRIFLNNSKEGLIADLLQMIKEKKSVYTTYLGLSEFLSEVDLVGLFIAEELKATLSGKYIDIATIVPKKVLAKLVFFEKEYIETILPNEVDAERKFKYLKVIFEKNGAPIKAQLKSGSSAYVIKELDLNLLFLE
jgi:CRISPR-associated protein Cas5h